MRTRSNGNHNPNPNPNKASFLKNCLGGLLARLIQVLDTTEISLVHAAVLMKDFSVSTGISSYLRVKKSLLLLASFKELIRNFKGLAV